ncbi:MAG: tetratricopeptide repeat protein, partial [Planctomycetota bacterium]
MAARVNKQFVIILVSVIVTLMIGVAALAVWMQSKTGETRVAQGDEAMAAGNYEEAERLYGRAVNKDQTRVDWLEKWIDALTKTTPQSELAYRKAYNELYIQALRQLSVNQPTKPQPLLNYIKEIDDRFALTGGQTASGYQSFVTQIDERARRLPEDDPLTKKIRGYRGRALLGLMIATSVDPEVREEALADLRAAAESDPADWESAYAIVRWHYAEAERFVREVRPDLAEPAMEKANAELRTLVDALGDTIPEVAVYELAVELEYRSREAATTEQRRAVIQELRPMAEAVVEQFETTPLEDVRVSALNRAFPTVSYILDRPGAEALLEVARRKLEAEPENPSVMTLAADFAKRTGSLEEAFDIYGRVAELADRPVSLIGYVMPFYRRAAVSERIGILIQKVDNAEEADRDALLAEAQAERDRYAEMVGAAQEGELKLRDAQIAIRRGENSRAIALLAELRRTTATDSPDVLLPLARALAGQGNFGEARRVYSELIDLEPRIAPMLELAQIELQQRNLTTALALYERAYVLAPENEEIAQRINLIKRGQGEQVTPTDLDPIVVAILDAREAVSSGDDARAVTILEAAYEKAPTDMRILRELIPLDISEGGRELAAQRVERSLQVDPNNGRLMALRTQLTETDPLKIQLEIVEQMDADDYTKHLARYNVYLQQDDMNDEALAELDAAEALKPNDKRLVDVRFNRALLEGDIDEARRWQERASDANLDERGGLLYLGRVQLAEGNTAEAESTLKRAVDRIEYDPEGWRWLARAQRLNGKVDAALASYKRAYEGRPDSADIAVEYATLLATSGKGAEALAVIGPETGLLRTGRQPNRV